MLESQRYRLGQKANSKSLYQKSNLLAEVESLLEKTKADREELVKINEQLKKD